ncbi:substrate import-associated zinc metallohydrolase lipoprotein [Sphingobacterium sp. PU5-4]|uniref:Substrate import-associated zinc metallohydrolase lipoprotein n=1 Tax=Sphingobacterium tenebrionis TaxID=3111775 RepID=A0ABU8I2Z1_9SPHI
MKIVNKILIALSVVCVLGSCAKEEVKNVDFSQYNDDDPQTKTELDNWLKTTFLDEYNIDVVYRYNRYYHDVDRNVTPPRLDAVKPTMESVLNGYLLPYRKVGGVDFIKKMSPKEWILFGSNSYASDGSVYAGTASAGRRVNLYGINNYSAYGALLVIHHEFVHILNQLVNIPTDFESISKADYKATWSTTPADTARKYGFVTSYASGSYTEDYAETAAHLLVKGQAWYDRYANSSSDAGKSKLKQKEANVANYYTSNLKVNFRELQKEIQNYLKSTVYPNDLKFPQYLASTYKTVTINPGNAIYSKYGKPAEFQAAYDKMKAAVLAYSSTAKYNLDYVQVRFEADNKATIRCAFTAAAGGTQYLADYSFTYAYNTTSGDLTFTKVEQAGTTGNYANAALFSAGFANSLQPYFTGKTYTADWLKADVEGADYNSLAGFYEKNNTTNYWYGVLGL